MDDENVGTSLRAACANAANTLEVRAHSSADKQGADRTLMKRNLRHCSHLRRGIVENDTSLVPIIEFRCNRDMDGHAARHRFCHGQACDGFISFYIDPYEPDTAYKNPGILEQRLDCADRGSDLDAAGTLLPVAFRCGSLRLTWKSVIPSIIPTAHGTQWTTPPRP
jgi:hypothetical protein